MINDDVPERLRELQRLVDDTLPFLVVTKLGVALNILNDLGEADGNVVPLTVKGKSFRRGCPSNPENTACILTGIVQFYIADLP